MGREVFDILSEGLHAIEILAAMSKLTAGLPSLGLSAILWWG